MSPKRSEPALIDAATIMVLREADEGFEVFMVRRHHKSGFMANAYVYPGGKLDEGDCSAVAAERVRGIGAEEACGRLREDIDGFKGLGLFLAGVRETFEEAGILLACSATSGELVDLTSDVAVAARFGAYRKALIGGELSLSELARREDLVIPLDRVGYFAHWITPYLEHRRFDTRFFVALAPANQHPLHDAVETTDSLWVRPLEAIEQYRAGALLLAPPTLRTLEQLARFASAQAALAFAKTHDPPTILPHFVEQDGSVALLLPGDRQFPSEDPDYVLATPVDDGVTRMMLVDGQWYSQKGEV
ncbi:MAG: NUDIX hydrolase [Bradymonadaceae bacterium]|nr:NUDIX hydrolase [Lujinxingiaceae bacterium]